MNKNALWIALGKYSVSCFAFVVGLLASGILLPQIAVWPAWTLVLRYTAGCALLGLPLATLSSRLHLNVLMRWVLFAQLAWVATAVVMGFEAVFFNTAGVVNGLLVCALRLLGLSLPLVLFSGAVAFLFRPAQQSAAHSRVGIRFPGLAAGQA